MVHSRFVLAVLLLAVLCLSSCGKGRERGFPAISCGAEAQPETQVTLFSPGRDVQEELEPGEVHGYDVRLAPGQSLQVVAGQDEVDLLLCWYGPEGRLYLGLDSPNGMDEPEELLWLPEEQGTFRLLIRALTEQGEPRRYSLSSRIGPASQHERERSAALLAGARGDELRRSRDPALWPRARKEYLLAFDRWTRLGDPGYQADVQNRLGYLYENRLQDLEQAAVSYDFAREGFARLGMRGREGRILASLGRVFLNRGRIDEALGYQRRALALFEQLGDRYEQAVALNEIGLLYDLLTEPYLALSSYSRALELWWEAGDREGMARTLHNRGLLYSSLGAYPQAMDDLSRAAETARRSEDPHLAATLTALANVHALTGQPDKGLPLLEEALTLRISAGELRGQAVTQSAIGLTLQRMGRSAEALDRHRWAQEIFDSLDDPVDKATALHNLGVALKDAGRFPEADRALASAVARGREVKDAEVVEASLFALAQINSDRGHELAALPLMREALKSIETFRLRPPGQGLRAAFFATKQDYYDFTVELLMELERQHPGGGYEVEALNVSERSRARSLLDLLQQRGIKSRQGGPADLIAARRRLDAAIRTKHKLVVRLREEGAPPQEWESSARELSSDLREYDRISAEIRRRSPGYQPLTEAPPLAATEIQQQVLNSGTILLYYKFGTQSSYLWAVTRDSIVSFRLAPRREIERLAVRLHDLLSVSDATARRQTELTLRRLSDLLLGPAWELLGDKRLLIVGEGALQSIPFAALPLPAEHGNGRPAPLIVAHEVVTAPSASALANLHEGRTPPKSPLERVALLADPVFSAQDPRVAVRRPPTLAVASTSGPPLARGGSSYGRLVYSRLEAQAISSLVKPGNLFTATGFSASRETVLSGALSNYQILHFATHGEIDARDPEFSRLVLSLVDEDGRPRDGFLYAYDIYGLDIPAELVVLSACGTGLGQQIRGEGLVGLPHAFLYAGAARVVVSLWSVDDRATAALFQSFYRHLLREGKTPSAALRAAQIEQWQRRPWPYYWAAFVLHDR